MAAFQISVISQAVARSAAPWMYP